MLFFGAVYCEITIRIYRKCNIGIIQFLHQNAISNEFISQLSKFVFSCFGQSNTYVYIF